MAPEFASLLLGLYLSYVPVMISVHVSVTFQEIRTRELTVSFPTQVTCSWGLNDSPSVLILIQKGKLN